MQSTKYHELLSYATERVKYLSLQSINHNIQKIDEAREKYESIDREKLSGKERASLVMVDVIVLDWTPHSPRTLSKIHINSVHYYDRLKKWQKEHTDKNERLF